MSRRSAGEGSVSQRADGRWMARLQVDGVRRVLYGKTRQEAVAKLDQLKREAAASGALPNPAGRTLDAAIDAWLEAKSAGWKPRTLADYQETVRLYVRPALGALPVEKIGPARISHHLTGLQREGHERAALKAYRLLDAVLTLSVRWNWISANPCERVDCPRYSPERKEVWTAQQARAFLDGTREHWLYPLWALAVYSGCRIGELVALEWSDLDLEAGSLTIRRAGQYIAGEWTVTTPKTRAGTRRLRLPQEAIDALRVHQAAQAQERLQKGADWTAGDLVFVGPRSGKPLDTTTVENALRRECRRLELPHMSPHALRHLSASMLLRAGLGLPDIARRLGHRDAGVTLRVYGHALGEDDSAAADALRDALQG